MAVVPQDILLKELGSRNTNIAKQSAPLRHEFAVPTAFALKHGVCVISNDVWDLYHGIIYSSTQGTDYRGFSVVSQRNHIGEPNLLLSPVANHTNKPPSSGWDWQVKGNTWKKFTNPSAARGKTVHPKTQAEQKALGTRWGQDGEVTKADGVYHKFELQANAGKVPFSIRQWRESNGGTHAVMATSYIKQNGTKEDVQSGLYEALRGRGIREVLTTRY